MRHLLGPKFSLSVKSGAPPADFGERDGIALCGRPAVSLLAPAGAEAVIADCGRLVDIYDFLPVILSMCAWYSAFESFR